MSRPGTDRGPRGRAPKLARERPCCRGLPDAADCPRPSSDAPCCSRRARPSPGRQPCAPSRRSAARRRPVPPALRRTEESFPAARACSPQDPRAPATRTSASGIGAGRRRSARRSGESAAPDTRRMHPHPPSSSRLRQNFGTRGAAIRARTASTAMRVSPRSITGLNAGGSRLFIGRPEQSVSPRRSGHRWHVEQSASVASWIRYAFTSRAPSTRWLSVGFQSMSNTCSTRTHVLLRRAMAVEAPLHFERRLRHMSGIWSTRPWQVDAADALGDVDAVVEVDVIGQVVDAVPLDAACPLRKLLATGASIGCRPDLRVAVHARRGRRDAAKRRVLDRRVAVAAIDAESPTWCSWLNGTGCSTGAPIAGCGAMAMRHASSADRAERQHGLARRASTSERGAAGRPGPWAINATPACVVHHACQSSGTATVIDSHGLAWRKRRAGGGAAIRFLSGVGQELQRARVVRHGSMAPGAFPSIGSPADHHRIGERRRHPAGSASRGRNLASPLPGHLSVEQIDYMLALGYSRRGAVSHSSRRLTRAWRLRTSLRGAVGFAALVSDWTATRRSSTSCTSCREHQRAGIGRALIEHVAARAQRPAAARSRSTSTANNAARSAPTSAAASRFARAATFRSAAALSWRTSSWCATL